MYVPPKVIAQALRVSANLICANPLPRERWIDFDEGYWQVNGQRVEDLGLWCLLVMTKEEVYITSLYKAVVGSIGLKITSPYTPYPIVNIDLGG